MGTISVFARLQYFPNCSSFFNFFLLFLPLEGSRDSTNFSTGFLVQLIFMRRRLHMHIYIADGRFDLFDEFKKV